MCEYWGAQAPSRDFRLGALFVVRWSQGILPKELWGEVWMTMRCGGVYADYFISRQ